VPSVNMLCLHARFAKTITVSSNKMQPHTLVKINGTPVDRPSSPCLVLATRRSLPRPIAINLQNARRHTHLPFRCHFFFCLLARNAKDHSKASCACFRNPQNNFREECTFGMPTDLQHFHLQHFDEQTVRMRSSMQQQNHQV
jgi:hypothetical protein